MTLRIKFRVVFFQPCLMNPKNLVNFPIEPVEFGIQLLNPRSRRTLAPMQAWCQNPRQKAVAWNLNASQHQLQTTWAQTWEQDLSSMSWSLEPKWLVSPLFFLLPFISSFSPFFSLHFRTSLSRVSPPFLSLLDRWSVTIPTTSFLYDVCHRVMMTVKCGVFSES